MFPVIIFNSFSPDNDFCWTHVVRSALDNLYLDISSDSGGWTEHRHPPTNPRVSRNMATHAHSARGISDFYINIMELFSCKNHSHESVCSQHFGIAISQENWFDNRWKAFSISDNQKREIRLILAFHFMLGKCKRLYCYYKQNRSPEKQTHSINTLRKAMIMPLLWEKKSFSPIWHLDVLLFIKPWVLFT